ncbi:uncharacterized protein LOC114843846 [Betta splendens]|uniref:Uncharacterized protein LOC114843846 n=1 Tax=Betta splendens TaxID=158456 RepID=A0A8M1H6U0_BETSP|nr:uncharacterized protein LOC114843846 [Betta splendens]
MLAICKELQCFLPVSAWTHLEDASSQSQSERRKLTLTQLWTSGQEEMSANSSSNSSFSFFLKTCFDSRTTNFIYLSFSMANIALLLPLFVYTLVLGLRQRRRPSSSDFFTYNVLVLELLAMLGSCLYCFGAYAPDPVLALVGSSICSITSPAQTLFHVLTSVERYLAVVRPVTYLGLRRAGALRVRNASAGCVWLLCCALMACSMYWSYAFAAVALLLLVSSLAVVALSGFSILCVLNDGGPGQVGGARRRACHAVMAVMAALTLRLAGVLVCTVAFSSPQLTHAVCALGGAAVWLTLPCSLVLPLLLLQRAGKLPGCRRSTSSG